MAPRRKDPGPRSMVRFIGRVIEGSRPGAYPGFVEPSLATLRTSPPRQDKYVHEIKLDGYRIQAHLRGGLPALSTRRAHVSFRGFYPSKKSKQPIVAKFNKPSRN